MRIFEHNFVDDKANFRRRAVARQCFLTHDVLVIRPKSAHGCADSKANDKHTMCWLFAQSRRTDAPTAKRITKRSQRQNLPKRRAPILLEHVLKSFLRTQGRISRPREDLRRTWGRRLKQICIRIQSRICLLEQSCRSRGIRSYWGRLFGSSHRS